MIDLDAWEQDFYNTLTECDNRTKEIVFRKKPTEVKEFIANLLEEADKEHDHNRTLWKGLQERTVRQLEKARYDLYRCKACLYLLLSAYLLFLLILLLR